MSSTSWRPHRLPILVAAAMLVVALGCNPATQQTDKTTTSAAGVGRQRVDPQLASQLQTYFQSSADVFRNRRAFLVSVDGQLAVEDYHKSSRETTHNIESVGKSVMSTLVGIALDDGHLDDLDQTLAELLPAFRDDMTAQVKAITLRQLLTMTAGFPEDNDFYPKVWGTNENWVRHILSNGPTGPPGTFQYSSAGSHLLSAILKQASGRSVLAYAKEKLFAPLGVDTTPAAEPKATPENLPAYRRAKFAWPTDLQGHHIGGGGQRLTARDLAKLGQLWLDGGRVGGRQVVSAAWVKEATTAHMGIGEIGYGPDAGYGYHFWATRAADHAAFTALGFGGQMIEVVPALGVVVVVQSTSPDDPTVPPEPGVADVNAYLDVVDNLVVPAIRP
jgi:CubicO group peptidase (beta-lactamase class C family)